MADKVSTFGKPAVNRACFANGGMYAYSEGAAVGPDRGD